VRYQTIDELERLIASAIPEGPSLHYKEALSLKTEKQRREFLKDLTGMANGGGGTLLFGVQESNDADAIPVAVTPLSDPALIGVSEDIIRAGVRPPLLLHHEMIDAPAGGFVWSVDVEPSPLGPYMVESYGTHTYFTRTGRSTHPMAEPQVRDAYALALRGRDQRAQRRNDHALPPEPRTAAPWLSISALPDGALLPTFDPGVVGPDDVAPDGALKSHLNGCGLDTAASRLGRWADGLFGTDSFDASTDPRSVIRLHRDGALAISAGMYSKLDPFFVARLLNAGLAYAAWLWEKFDLRQAVELRIRLDHLSDASMAVRNSFLEEERVVNEPPGVPTHAIEASEYAYPSDLGDAGKRAAIVHRFVNRIFQAFGQSNPTLLFRAGKLYGEHGQYTGVALLGGGLWREPHAGQCAFVFDDGSVRNPSQQLVGFHVGGAIVAENGDAVASLEMPDGSACPLTSSPSSSRRILAFRWTATLGHRTKLRSRSQLQAQRAGGHPRPSINCSRSEPLDARSN
jgi:hypothetical protein